MYLVDFKLWKVKNKKNKKNNENKIESKVDDTGTIITLTTKCDLLRRELLQRKAKIANLGTEIDTFQANAKSRSEEFDQKFRDARRNAKSEFDSARNEAQEAGAAKLKQIKEESDKVKTDNLSKVAADIQAAEQTLKGQVESFATEMAGKVLGRAL